MSTKTVFATTRQRLDGRWASPQWVFLGALAAVQLAAVHPQSAVAFDDPPATASGVPAKQIAGAQTEEAKSDDSQSDDAKTDKPLTTASLMKMLQSGKLDVAAAQVDAALAENSTSNAYYWSYLLAGRQAQSDPAAARARYEKIVSEISAKLQQGNAALDTQAMTAYVFSAQSLSMQLVKQDKHQQALKLLEDVAQRLAQVPSLDGSLTGSLRSGIDVQRGRLLIALNRVDEARVLMDQQIQAKVAQATKSDSVANLQALTSAISSYGLLFRESSADKLDEYRQAASKLLLATLEKESSTPAEFQIYQTMQITTAMDLSDTDMPAAIAMIEQLKEQADKFSEKLDEKNRSRMVLSATSLKSALSRLESKKKIAELIGKPAPDWDIEAVVNMDKTQLADLKGKVVLIDFWAVWCGPCIATFPHLKHWHEQYADKGLVIVGATRAYGYTWDAAEQRTVSKKDATLDEELAMLEEFRKFHKLEHGFVVTPQGSTFAKQYGVTGIPQAVLVDQSGNIQMIRVGSGDKNATDLENKIKELLGVSDAPAKSTPAG